MKALGDSARRWRFGLHARTQPCLFSALDPRPAWGFGPGAWALTEVWSLLNDLIPVLLDNMALSSIGTRKSDLHKAMLWQRSIHKRTTWALH